MRSARRLFRLIFKLFALLTALVLVLLLVWTMLEIGGVYHRQQGEAGTMEARQPFYDATATALADDGVMPRLQSQPRTILLQQSIATATPPPDSEAVDLPGLLMPHTPPPGLILKGTAVPTRVPPIQREHEIVNIALLGGDDEITDGSFGRTDTMIILSLNMETGTAAMLSLPRDLFVYIPSGTMGRLNLAFGIGENNDWQPDGGFGLLRQTIFYNFGINVHYYVRVNFSAFETLIDLVGGVDIAVDCAYQDYYPVEGFDPRALPGDNYELRTLDVGYYTFNGFDALWYARTRRLSDDFDRGRRQQQLLRAIWRKTRASGWLANLPALWGELTEIVDTNLTFDLMLRLLPHALRLDVNSLQNFTMVRTWHTQPWQPPDGSFVQLPQYEPIADLLRDFYAPPTANQQALAGPSIAVYNGAVQPNWDRVATERLRWDGYHAVAMGEKPPVESSRLVDYVASEKGSLVPGISHALNLSPAQVQIQPNPAREVDYEVILGADYESCTFGVLPVED